MPRGSNLHANLSGGCMVLFGLPFLLAGLGIVYFLGIRPFANLHASQQWVETPARVVSSEVRTHRDSDSTTYSVDINYTYEWEGETYHSDRYDFLSASSSGYQRKREVVRAHPAGRVFTVYVNPANPSEAVIHRETSWEYYIGFVFGGLFALVGAGVMIGGARFAAKTRRGLSGAARGGKDGSVPGVPTPDETDVRGDVTLKPSTPRWAKVVGTLVFALFWNGVISFFLMEVWQSWQRGSPNWFLTIFMTPFVLIGLGAILGFFYTLLATFNPRVLLILGPGNPVPGKRTTLDWAFAGSTSRLQSFRLVLEGLERATYSQGTTTYTDENIFFRQVLVEVRDPVDIRDGTIAFEPPPDAPPSFDAPSNKIIWRIAVHGKINFWPDVRDNFSFVLTPIPAEAP